MNNRTLQVEAAGDFFKSRIHPKIRLQGQWLAALGFPPGSRVQIIPLAAGQITLQSIPTHPCDTTPLKPTR